MIVIHHRRFSLPLLALPMFIPSLLAAQTTPDDRIERVDDALHGRLEVSQTERSSPMALTFRDEAVEEDAYFEDETSEEETVSETTTGDSILWDGFIYGDPHFRDTPRPIGSPLYFEDPFINSDVRAGFIWHKFPNNGGLRGGQLTVYTLQLRLALTERLQFMATTDGYSHLESPILDDDSGWNDLAFGLKYALYVDHENDFLLSTGLRWRLSNGHANTLNGGVDELNPFISAYKGVGKWNFMAHVGGRIAMDEHKGNHILSWDMHVDYELMENFFPLLEVHGLHYLSNGDNLPLDIGGGDYANIGSNNVAGTAAYWGSLGFRWNIVDHISWGTAWDFPLQNPDNNDIFEQRVTTDVIFTF